MKMNRTWPNHMYAIYHFYNYCSNCIPLQVNWKSTCPEVKFTVTEVLTYWLFHTLSLPHYMVQYCVHLTVSHKQNYLVSLYSINRKWNTDIFHVCFTQVSQNKLGSDVSSWTYKTPLNLLTPIHLKPTTTFTKQQILHIRILILTKLPSDTRINWKCVNEVWVIFRTWPHKIPFDRQSDRFMIQLKYVEFFLWALIKSLKIWRFPWF